MATVMLRITTLLLASSLWLWGGSNFDAVALGSGSNACEDGVALLDDSAAKPDTIQVPISPPSEGVAESSDALPTTADDIEKIYGIPVVNQVKFQSFSDDSGVIIQVRPTNPESVRWLKDGALPKPEFLKSKTINRYDVLLGAKGGMEGTVGFFCPKLDLDAVPDEDQQRVKDRFIQRWEEHNELEPKMTDLQKKGTIRIVDGVVYGFNNNHEMKPYTGDHDIFDLRDAINGSQLPEDRYNQLIDDMRASDMGVMHGAHMYWIPTTDFERSIYNRIIAEHQPGMTPLVQFAPKLKPTLVYATTPVVNAAVSPIS
ncbi:hypothetical protein [Streptomyces wuyuanensis]|uniref:hypothetical protein n=1 Tax=Streptomyces wuyuanensis TaxID=1196353 RepID=UPI0034166725